MTSPEQQSILDAVQTLTACTPEELDEVTTEELAMLNLEVEHCGRNSWQTYAHAARYRRLEAHDSNKGCAVFAEECRAMVESKDEPGIFHPVHQLLIGWEDDNYTAMIEMNEGEVAILKEGDSSQSDRILTFEASRSPAWKARILSGISALTDTQLGVV